MIKGHITCPHCKNNDSSLLEITIETAKILQYLCAVCGKTFWVPKDK